MITRLLVLLTCASLLVSACGGAPAPAGPAEPAAIEAPVAPTPGVVSSTPVFKSTSVPYSGGQLQVVTPEAVPTPTKTTQQTELVVDHDSFIQLAAYLTPVDKHSAEMVQQSGTSFSCTKLTPLINSFMNMTGTQGVVDAVWVMGTYLKTQGYFLLGSVALEKMIYVWVKNAADTGYVILSIADTTSSAMPGGIFSLMEGTNAEGVLHYLSRQGIVYLTELGASEVGNLQQPVFVLRSDPQADQMLKAVLMAVGVCLMAAADNYASNNKGSNGTTLIKPSEKYRVTTTGGQSHAEFVLATVPADQVDAFLEGLSKSAPYLLIAGVIIVACFATGICEITTPLWFLAITAIGKVPSNIQPAQAEFRKKIPLLL